jgi:hypothetical protein
METVEARLEQSLVKGSIWENRRLVERGEAYGKVEDYDPVLRSHCRLEEEGNCR